MSEQKTQQKEKTKKKRKRKQTEIIHYRVLSSEREDMEKLSDYYEITLSDLLRKIYNDFLERQRQGIIPESLERLLRLHETRLDKSVIKEIRREAYEFSHAQRFTRFIEDLLRKNNPVAGDKDLLALTCMNTEALTEILQRERRIMARHKGVINDNMLQLELRRSRTIETALTTLKNFETTWNTLLQKKEMWNGLSQRFKTQHLKNARQYPNSTIGKQLLKVYGAHI